MRLSVPTGKRGAPISGLSKIGCIKRLVAYCGKSSEFLFHRRRQAVAGRGKIAGAAVEVRATTVVVHPAFAPVMEAITPLAEATHDALAHAPVHAVAHQHLQAVFLGVIELVVEGLGGI